MLGPIKYLKINHLYVLAPLRNALLDIKTLFWILFSTKTACCCSEDPKLSCCPAPSAAFFCNRISRRNCWLWILLHGLFVVILNTTDAVNNHSSWTWSSQMRLLLEVSFFMRVLSRSFIFAVVLEVFFMHSIFFFFFTGSGSMCLCWSYQPLNDNLSCHWFNGWKSKPKHLCVASVVKRFISRISFCLKKLVEYLPLLRVLAHLTCSLWFKRRTKKKAYFTPAMTSSIWGLNSTSFVHSLQQSWMNKNKC